MESENSDEEETKQARRSSSLVYKHGNAKLTREEYMVIYGQRSSTR